MLVPVYKISGFKEFLPEEQVLFDRMKRIIAKHYELFGFVPIEVAAVERKEVLLSKSGENTKQIYGIHLIERSDQQHGESDKDLALHFDLTIPLARYVAQNYGKLNFPFRRYQIQKVWRGERPQEGRFREFYQCDIDVIGDGQLGLLHDAEMPAVIYGIFSELQVGEFLIRLNNRKIHNGLLSHLGIPLHFSVPIESEGTGEPISSGMTHNTLTLIDKMEKEGVDATKWAFRTLVGVNEEQIDALLRVIMFKDEPAKTLAWLKSLDYGDLFAEGVAELTEVIGHMRALGVPDGSFSVDLAITRGLDYYTGTVYETTLVNRENIGSVCSGGRYEDLASTFIDRKLPGVGISIGLTRLFDKLTRPDGPIKVDSSPKSMAKVLIVQMTPDLLSDYFRLATELRAADVPCEVYLEDRKVDKQIKYAVCKRIPYMVFLDQKRKEKGVCTVRHFEGNELEVPLDKLAEYLS